MVYKFVLIGFCHPEELATKNPGCIQVDVIETLRFALSDRKREMGLVLRGCISMSKSAAEGGCFLPTVQRT